MYDDDIHEFQEVVGMISPEKWVDLLRLYGPAAMFIFMVFVLRKIAQRTAGLSDSQKRVQDVAFTLVWCSIFVLCILDVFVWWRITFPEEFIVSGTIHNLRYPEMISSDQDLYLHRHFVALPDFEYNWRLISSKRFIGSVVLRLQKKPSDTQVARFEVPIRGDFYRGTVEINYDRAHETMTLEYGGKKESIPARMEVPGEISSAGGSVNPPRFAFTVYAYQGSQSKPQDVIRLLDADDPLLRQVARRDLIALGPAALPVFERALADPGSSYRLIVGILSALKESQQAKLLLGKPAICAIAKAAQDPDVTMRSEARDVLAAGVTVPSNCSLGNGSASPKTRAITGLIPVPASFRPVAISRIVGSTMAIGDQSGKVYSYETELIELGSLPKFSTLIDIVAGIVQSQQKVFVLGFKESINISTIYALSRPGGNRSSWELPPGYAALALDDRAEQVLLCCSGNLAKLDVSSNSSKAQFLNVNAPLLGTRPIIALDASRKEIIAIDGVRGDIFAFSYVDHASIRAIKSGLGLISQMGYDPSTRKIFISQVGRPVIMVDADNGSVRPYSKLVLNDVTGIATDVSGDVWVTSMKKPRVRSIRSDGTESIRIN